jgi:4-hydroxythreonine-4-phosphate dehydrogenase
VNKKPIIIVAGEPNSIFLEIFFKVLKNNKFKSPLILICSIKVLKSQMKHFKFKKKINLISYANIKYSKLNNDEINLINVNYEFTKTFEKISTKSKKYINKCFVIALKLIKDGAANKMINGPVSKKHFLNQKFPGVTEYLAKISNSKSSGMLIFNKELSVCPLTTHLPIKLITKKITKNLVKEKIELVNNFYLKYLKLKPRIAVTGLNPHCESILKFNEDEKILKPTIKAMKKKNINVNGPFPADTIFSKKNRRFYDVVIGMYHDQVLAPIKALYEFDAINITMGLPFLRATPDHGPNEGMVGKNLSNSTSLIRALEFLEKNDKS